MTATTENLCCDCGAPAPVFTLVETEIPMRYCAACAERHAAEEDERQQRESLDRALLRAGATPRLLPMTLATHPDARAVAAARDFITSYRENVGANLWLSGPVGLGKTGLAWGIVRELVEDAVRDFWQTDEAWRGIEPAPTALFLRWADLLTDLKASIGREADAAEHDPNDLLERAKRIPVLALDDLGRERPTPYALEKLGNLVNERYERKRLTVVTTNYTRPELADHLTTEGGSEVEARRIIDRLREGTVTYEFTGTRSRRA
jgi:DNA replication protein DnaC